MQPGIFEQYWFFWILSSTVSNRYVYKEIVISVTEQCVNEPQQMTLRNAGYDEFVFSKNNGVEMLLDTVEIKDLVNLENENRCQLNQFDVIHANGSAVSFNDELYRVLDLDQRQNFSLQVNTNTFPTDGTVEFLSYEFVILITSDGNT